MKPPIPVVYNFGTTLCECGWAMAISVENGQSMEEGIVTQCPNKHCRMVGVKVRVWLPRLKAELEEHALIKAVRKVVER